MGVGKVANNRNWSRTAAIEVCLAFNFAVVFIFLYFRYCPSKAKSIGNVLTNNRQSAANCSSPYMESLRNREFKKSAEELRMGIPALRQYIDAMIHLSLIARVSPFRLKFFFAYKRNKANLDPFHLCFTISL
jgi:hypothetical protein